MKLTTIINLSGISPYDNIRDNLIQVKKALKSLDIVEKILVKADYVMNPETRRKQLVDATIFIYPSKDFVQ